MQPVPSRGTACLARRQVALIDLFQMFSLGSFLTVIWSLANVRRKGQLVTVSTCKKSTVCYRIPGYSVNQAGCAPSILAHFLKAVWVVFNRPMASFPWSSIVFSYVLLCCSSRHCKCPQGNCGITRGACCWALLPLNSPACTSETVLLYTHTLRHIFAPWTASAGCLCSLEHIKWHSDHYLGT